MQVCFHCKKALDSRRVPYQDIETNVTRHYHQDCWFGPVREAVVNEYVDLIMRVSHFKLQRGVK